MDEATQQEEVLQLLRNIHANQLKAIEIQTRAIDMQSTQLALVQSNVAKTEGMANESIELQRIAVQRQQSGVRYFIPVILILMAIIIFDSFTDIF